MAEQKIDFKPDGIDFTPDPTDITDPNTFVGPEEDLGLLGKTKRSVDNFILHRLDQLSGEKPGVLNPIPQQNPLIDKPIVEPFPRNQRLAQPELFGPDNRTLPGKIVDSVYDTGAAIGNSLFSPLGILGTLMGSNPADLTESKTLQEISSPNSEVADLSKLKIVPPEATIKSELSPTLKANRMNVTPEGKIELKPLPKPEDVKIQFEAATNPFSELENKLNSKLGLDDEIVTPTEKPPIAGNETGELKLRGIKSPEVEDIRKKLISSITTGGKINLGDLYASTKGRVTENQFHKIINDIMDSGDLERLAAERRAANLARDTSPMQMAPTENAEPQQQLRVVLDQVKANIVARNEQDALVRAEKSKRFSAARDVTSTGLAGHFQRLKELKGEYPKVTPSQLTEAISPEAVNQITDSIYHSAEPDIAKKIRLASAFHKAIGKTPARGALQPGEIDALTEFFGPQLSDELVHLNSGISPNASGSLAYQDIKDTAGFAKANLSSLDFPGLFRAGKLYVGRKSWRDAIGPAMKSYFSQNTFDDLIGSIKNDPVYQQALDDGLSISDLVSKYAVKREEANASNLANKVPWVKASNRGQTAFVDKMRFNEYKSQIEQYKNYVNSAMKNGADPKSLDMMNPANDYVRQQIADGINTATMRGKLPGKLEHVADDLNVFFYSPRSLSAQIRNTNRLFNPIEYYQASPLQRMDRVKQLLSLASIIGTTTGVGKYLMNASVDNRPITSDFGKIKIGDTRLDDLGGFQQLLVPAMKIIYGASISPNSNKLSLLGDFGKDDAADIINNFFTTKNSPTMNLGSSLLTGKEFGGSPTNFKSFNPFVNTAAKDTITPLLAQDIYDLAVHDPSFMQSLMVVPASFGMGMQTFNPEDSKNPNQEQINSEGKLRREDLKLKFGAQ